MITPTRNVISLLMVTIVLQTMTNWVRMDLTFGFKHFCKSRSGGKNLCGKREEKQPGIRRLHVDYVNSYDFMLHGFVPFPALAAPLFPWSQAVYNLCLTWFIFYLNELILNTLLNKLYPVGFKPDNRTEGLFCSKQIWRCSLR